MRHGQHHGARRGRPARGPPQRAPAAQRHGHPGAARRPAPHRQRAQCHVGGGGLVLGGAHHRRRGVDRPVVELSGRLRVDGTDVRALRHPHARGGAQAALHQQAMERLDRHVGGGLPRLHAGPAVPPRALRPPQGRVRARRARHRLLRALPLHAPGAVPAPVSRRRRHQRVEELRAARQEHARAQGPFRPIGLSIFGVQAALVGGHVGGHRALVDLPALVVAALDDRVARDQPAALHRGARRHGAQPGPPGHDAQRATVAARTLLDRALQHRLASGPPRRHGRALAQPARVPRRAASGPAT